MKGKNKFKYLKYFNKRNRSKNLSIMFTDIQGYTRTASSFSRQENIELIRKHNSIMLPIICYYNGKIIRSIGDGYLITFESATDSVVCGIVIQLILWEYNKNLQDESLKLEIRIVINTGDVAIEGDDIYGDGVNIAARMEDMDCFYGGTLGISESTYLLINHNEILTENIGVFQLRGIPYPIRLYKVPIEEQNIEAVPEKLIKTAENILKSPRAMDNNLTEWKSLLISYLDSDAFKKYNKFKEELSRQTKSVLQELKEKKGSLSHEFKGELYKQGKGLKKGLAKGLNKIKGILSKED